jgi:hypothetical protein
MLAEVIYQPKIPANIIPADHCTHSDIHVGIELTNGGIGIGAKLCLCCGRVVPLENEYRNYFAALGHFWAEFGWHTTIGPRLQQFADAATETEIEAAMALDGFAPDEAADWRRAFSFAA